MSEEQYSEYLFFATTRCNCRCKHCNPKVYTGKDVELKAVDMITQYENSKCLPCTPVSVAGGEPFVKEDVIEFIKYLDRKKIPTVVSTNGWFTERVRDLLNQLESRDTVRFAISIDGIEEKHDKIRSVKGIYKKAVETALLIKERGFKIQINSVIQKDNLDDLDEFDAFFKEKGIEVVYIPEIFVWEEDFNFSNDDIRKILKYANYPKAKKYLLSKGQWKIRNCHAGKNSWLIDCNGDVYTCCGGYYKENSSDYIIGNILNSSFDEVFLSAKKEEVYKNVVLKCEGCLLPRDIERETNVFGFSTKLTYDEVSVLADDLSSISRLSEYSIDDDEWYPAECFEGEVFRWMKSLKSRAYVNIKHPASNIEISLINAIPELFDTSIVLRGKSKSIELEKVRVESGKRIISIPIPSEFQEQGLIEVSILIDKKWRPKDYNSDSMDDRELGLGVFSIELK